jgi:DNA-binding transcriptional MerR regulator
MAKELHQITFEFSAPEEPKEEQKEFLSGKVIEPKKEKPKSPRGRKRIKDVAEEAEHIEIPDDEVLFQKQYYTIGEVGQMFRVNTSLLRYWESEFGMQLRKNRKGDRYFTPQDIKFLQLVHDLIRRRKFTIEGAKDYIKREKGANERYEMIQSLKKLRSFLLELKAHL